MRATCHRRLLWSQYNQITPCIAAHSPVDPYRCYCFAYEQRVPADGESRFRCHWAKRSSADPHELLWIHVQDKPQMDALISPCTSSTYWTSQSLMKASIVHISLIRPVSHDGLVKRVQNRSLYASSRSTLSRRVEQVHHFVVLNQTHWNLSVQTGRSNLSHDVCAASCQSLGSASYISWSPHPNTRPDPDS